MKIVFTISSNNYLAQAKSLGDSIKLSSPDYEFYIGLTDNLNDNIDYPAEIAHNIITANEIGIPDFDTLWKKYSIVEFNTCVKPFYFQYFVKRFPDLEYIIYLDPDTLVYNSLSLVEQEFEEHTNILLTPHVLTPIPLDNKMPNENLFLNYGTYNLGFLALKKPSTADALLKWWAERTYSLGFINPAKGIFVDQLWFNLVPTFFRNVKVSSHPGLNMAPWNLHERSLSERDGLEFINDTYPLIFYHFSNYNYSEPDVMTKTYNRHNFLTRPGMKKIYSLYHKSIIENGIEKLSKIKCYYMLLHERHLQQEYKKKISGSKLLFLIHCLKKVIGRPGLKLLQLIK